MTSYSYIHDGKAIYRQSFATIRAETDLSAFTATQAKVVVRMIHACGQTEISKNIFFSPDFINAAETALQTGKAIFCDAAMIERGITRSRLPAENKIICTLHDDKTPVIAQEIGNTRSAAALHLWGSSLQDALVVIGNAPTALFHLMELLDDKILPNPAAIIGVPVGFVGAAESKEMLTQWGKIPHMIVKGRQGGSAMAVAAVNALAQEQEITP